MTTLLLAECRLIEQLRALGFDPGPLGDDVDTVLATVIGQAPGG